MRTPFTDRFPTAVRAVGAAVVGIIGFGLAALGGPPAGAATTSLVWSAPTTYGSTDRTIDGDTVAVRVDGDGTDVAPPHVRNTGIQAMEVGQCHSAEATAAMKVLVTGQRVQLTTTNAASSSMGRPVRHIEVVRPDGSLLDTQLAQLQGGHVLPAVLGGDATRWKPYFTAAQQAARNGKNLWDTDACGSGPSQDTPLRVWANWDGNGPDTPANEWVRVYNGSSTVLGIGGWWVRTGAQDSFVFPSTARVPAKGTLTLWVGQGTNTTTSFYWGSAVTKFANANVAANAYGNGAYLFDPQGDLRAWSIYPCLHECSDPLAGKVSVAVRADADGVDADNVNGEYVRLSPAGTSRIDLSYKVLSANGYTHEFPKGSVVEPGETLTVHVGRGYSSRLRQYWGNASPVLANGGGTVELRSPESVRIACRQWGTGRC